MSHLARSEARLRTILSHGSMVRSTNIGQTSLLCNRNHFSVNSCVQKDTQTPRSPFFPDGLKDLIVKLGIEDDANPPISPMDLIRLPHSLLAEVAQHYNEGIAYAGTPEFQMSDRDKADSLIALLHPHLTWFRSSILVRRAFTFKGDPASGGRIKYILQSYFDLPILVVEVKLDLEKDHTKQRNAMAQLTMECLAQSLETPMFGPHTDGTHFDLIRVNNTIQPPTLEHALPRSTTVSFQRLRLIHPSASSLEGFWETLRPISESFHTLFVDGYSRGLDVGLKKSLRSGSDKASAWMAAKELASESVAEGREATRLAHSGELSDADILADSALKKLGESIDLVPMPRYGLF